MADYNRNRGNQYSNEHLWDQNRRQPGYGYDEGYSRPMYSGGYGSTGYSGSDYGYRSNYGDQYGGRSRYNQGYGGGMGRMSYGEMYHGNVEDRERQTGQAQGSRYAGRSRWNEDYRGSSYGGYEGSNYDRDRDWWDRTRDEVSSWFGDDDAERRREMDKRMSGEHRGKGPRGYKRSDERIQEDVCDRLSDDAYVDASEVEVKVQNSEVVLSGTVPSREEKRRAEDLAESVSGVTNVQNLLRVERPTSTDNVEGSTLETRRMMEDQRRRWW